MVTDDNGKARLVISEEKSGNYNVSVSYGGDDKHNGCSAKTTITLFGDSTADSSATASTSGTNNSSTVNSNKEALAYTMMPNTDYIMMMVKFVTVAVKLTECQSMI